MSKTLAIKGHSTRGKEVIELLEMLGGNTFNSLMENTHPNRVYYISNNNAITWTNIYSDNGCLDTEDFFTLEEFLEKFPFKVGDIVKFDDSLNTGTITNMNWHNEDIVYHVQSNHIKEWKQTFSVNVLKKYTNMETKVESTGYMQMGKTVAVIFNEANYEDEVELQLGDYEIEVRDGKTYAVKKKPVYPTSYDECCKILGCKSNHFFTDFSYNGLDIEISNYEDKIDELLQNFRKLRYCRDAYWKIAGEEMGLDKPWEPDWQKTEERKFCIIRKNDNVITKWETKTIVKFLAFPTEEMRDAFYENFKDLIEQCKELL